MKTMLGPFKFSVHVHVVNDETSQVGSAEVHLPIGKVPTIADLHWAVGETLRTLPDGFRLMNGDEFFNQLLKDEFGAKGRFAMPEEYGYDVDALTAAGAAAVELRRAKRAKRRADRSGEEE